MRKKLLSLLALLITSLSLPQFAAASVDAGRIFFFETSDQWNTETPTPGIEFYRDGKNAGSLDFTQIDGKLFYIVVPGSNESWTKFNLYRKNSDHNWNKVYQCSADGYFLQKDGYNWDSTINYDYWSLPTDVKVKGDVAATSSSDDGWSKSADMTQGDNKSVWTKEFEVKKVYDGKCYFVPYIHGVAFGPSGDTAVGSGANLSNKEYTAGKFYINANVGEKWRITLNLNESKVYAEQIFPEGFYLLCPGNSYQLSMAYKFTQSGDEYILDTTDSFTANAQFAVADETGNIWGTGSGNDTVAMDADKDVYSNNGSKLKFASNCSNVRFTFKVKSSHDWGKIGNIALSSAGPAYTVKYSTNGSTWTDIEADGGNYSVTGANGLRFKVDDTVYYFPADNNTFGEAASEVALTTSGTNTLTLVNSPVFTSQKYFSGAVTVTLTNPASPKVAIAGTSAAPKFKFSILASQRTDGGSEAYTENNAVGASSNLGRIALKANAVLDVYAQISGIKETIALDNEAGYYNVSAKVEWDSSENKYVATPTLTLVPSYTVYFVDTNATQWGVDDLRIHTWGGVEGTGFNGWDYESTTPPYTVTNLEGNLYKITWYNDAAPTKILFRKKGTGNGNAGSTKTNDLNFVNGNYYVLNDDTNTSGSSVVPDAATITRTLDGVFVYRNGTKVNTDLKSGATLALTDVVSTDTFYLQADYSGVVEIPSKKYYFDGSLYISDGTTGYDLTAGNGTFDVPTSANATFAVNMSDGVPTKLKVTNLDIHYYLYNSNNGWAESTRTELPNNTAVSVTITPGKGFYITNCPTNGYTEASAAPFTAYTPWTESVENANIGASWSGTIAAHTAGMWKNYQVEAQTYSVTLNHSTMGLNVTRTTEASPVSVYFVDTNATQWGADNIRIKTWIIEGGVEPEPLYNGWIETDVDYTVTKVAGYTNLYKVTWNSVAAPDRILFRQKDSESNPGVTLTRNLEFVNGNYYTLTDEEDTSGSATVPATAIRELAHVYLYENGSKVQVSGSDLDLKSGATYNVDPTKTYYIEAVYSVGDNVKYYYKHNDNANKIHADGTYDLHVFDNASNRFGFSARSTAATIAVTVANEAPSKLVVTNYEESDVLYLVGDQFGGFTSTSHPMTLDTTTGYYYIHLDKLWNGRGSESSNYFAFYDGENQYGPQQTTYLYGIEQKVDYVASGNSYRWETGYDQNNCYLIVDKANNAFWISNNAPSESASFYHFDFYLRGENVGGWENSTAYHFNYDAATGLYYLDLDNGLSSNKFKLWGNLGFDNDYNWFGDNVTMAAGGYYTLKNNNQITANEGNAKINITPDANHKLRLSFHFTKPASQMNQEVKFYVSLIDREIKANMPLSKSDFKDGKKHYFLVGNRTSDWRLQPEWELLPQDDGTYAITEPGRFVYTGHYGVAMVDNYNDYAMQRFTYYTASGDTNKKLESAIEVTLTQDATKRSCVRSGSTNLKDLSNKLYLQNNGYSYYDCPGKYIGTISFDPSDNKLTLTPGTTDDAKAERIYQLVGNGIINQNYTADGKTPLGNYSGGWAKSWIQYDNDGKPYVDGNGDFVFQTVYQKSWFDAHPTLFKNEKMEYSSNTITFVKATELSDYDTDPFRHFYAAHESTSGLQIGNGADGQVMKDPNSNHEMVYDYNETLLHDLTRTATADDPWVCYVIKDVWLYNEFKLWTGWGGSNYRFEGGNTDGERWNIENGGPSDKITKSGNNVTGGTIVNSFDIASGKNVTLYPVFMNKDGSDRNFAPSKNLEDMCYYDRVILWINEAEYDTDYVNEDNADHKFAHAQGLGHAVLQLITMTGTPTIQASQQKVDDKAQITCKIGFANTEGVTEHKVVSYQINRYQVIKNTETLSKEAVFTGEPENAKVGTFSVDNLVDNNNNEGLNPGTYVYEVVTVTNDGSGNLTTKRSKSTRVTIINEDSKIIPVPRALQLVELRRVVATDADLVKDATDNNYTKDITLADLTAALKKHNKTLSDAQAATAAEKIKGATDRGFRYLTYRANTGDNYYIIKAVKNGSGAVTGYSMIDVDNTTARALFKTPEAFYWTSNYYVRALDYTDYVDQIEKAQDNGLMINTNIPVPTVTATADGATVNAYRTTVMKPWTGTGTTATQGSFNGPYNVAVTKAGSNVIVTATFGGNYEGLAEVGYLWDETEGFTERPMTKVAGSQTYSITLASYDRSSIKFRVKIAYQQNGSNPNNMGVTKQYEFEIPTADGTTTLGEEATGEEFYCAIVERHGNLAKANFNFGLTYQFQTSDDTVNRESSAAADVLPVLPQPWGITHNYEIVQSSASSIPAGAKVKVTTDSRSGRDADAKDDATLTIQEEFKPRYLQCDFIFNRPNIDKDIIDYYDIIYRIKVDNDNEDVAMSSHFDEYYYDPTEKLSNDKYTIYLENVHPRDHVNPVIAIPQTTYKKNGSAGTGYGESINASYAYDELNYTAESTLNTTPTTIKKFDATFVDFNKYPIDEWGYKMPTIHEGFEFASNWAESSGSYNCGWVYIGHEDLKKESLGSVGGALLENLLYYMVETVLPAGAESAEYSLYPSLMKHDHPSSDPYAKAILSRYTNKSYGTYDPVKQDWSRSGTLAGESPIFILTPVYVFYRDPKHNETLTTSPANFAKWTGTAPKSSVRARVNMLADTDTDPELITLQGEPATIDTSDSSSGGNLTGMEEISVDVNDGEEMYFNLQGIRIENPTSGVYIRVRGRNAEKVYVR